jgi:molecular chaperone GrpE
VSKHDAHPRGDSSLSTDERRESTDAVAAEKKAASASAPSREPASEDESSTADTGRQEAEGGPEAAPDGGGADTVEGDLDELVKVSAQRDEYLALAQRTQADFENYRKRMAKEARVAEARGVIKLAKELLPALDNLARALDSADQDDPLLDGVRLVYSDLLGALKRVGIEAYSPTGERFDPAEHEAMAQQPTEGAEPGTVVEVYQAGYRWNGTIIRPARVVVAA